MKPQEKLFTAIRNLYKKETTGYINDLSALLNVEKGAVYKRLNGDTILKIDEILLLCKKFRLSFDDIVFSDDEFNVGSIENRSYAHKDSSFLAFLENHGDLFNSLRRGTENTAVLLFNQLPVVYLFGYPRLILFYYYFSKYEFHGFPKMEVPIHLHLLEPKEEKLLKFLSSEYSNHPTVEILGNDLIQAFIEKIKLSVRMGLISENAAKELGNDLYLMLKTQYRIASAGKKIDPYTDQAKADVKILFNNLHTSGANFYYYNTDGYERVFFELGYNDIIGSYSKGFCSYIQNKINTFRLHSSNITVENVTKRDAFFSHLEDSVGKLME